MSLAFGPLFVAAFVGCDHHRSYADDVVGIFGRRGFGPGDFSYPRAISTARDGRVFVVDKNGRVQRFSADGHFEAGWKMPQTERGKPVGLTVHPDGRLFIADTHYSRVSILDRDGKLLQTFGKEGTGAGEMFLPTDVAVDANGFVYVSEYQGNDRITKWSPSLEYISALGEEPINDARLRRPAGLDIDSEQTLWIADACNHRIVRITLDGEVLSTFGTFGSAPGELRYPYDICVAPDDTILVCEYEGNRLQWFSKDGTSLRTWGGSGREPGELSAPWGATYGPNGRVYVVDSLNNRVQIVQP
jgi:DNA-binding beta-propeller fold protein YncE